jgi:hypothetical protein
MKKGCIKGGTPRGCNCVNLFDPVIAVYQKQLDRSNLFLTTCKITPMERDHLIATDGNFVTEPVLLQQQGLSIQDPTITNNNGLQ